MEKFYSLVEASEILGIKLRTVRQWVSEGYLQAKRYNSKKKLYIPQSEIERVQNKMIKR